MQLACISLIKNILSLPVFLLTFVLTSVSDASSQAVTTRHCDLFAAATHCVATISTTRALFSGYTGPLYQVTRESDNTSHEIGLLPSGYGDAAAQDTFCANTRCAITRLYDQSPNHNDLVPAPGSHHGSHHASGPGPNGHDVPARAKVLLVKVDGHKAYGIAVTPGTGYRNDQTRGVAVHGQPEGVYMVTSALRLNSKCFDFGNAETDNNDNGAGHMDAINIRCAGYACNRIAANLDIEDGLFGHLTVSSDLSFDTDMGANDGQYTYALYQGNAQSGRLTSTGPLPLPGKYAPMRQEAAIVLDIGDDNSNLATGYFLEGVMTKGIPTSEAMDAVQSNIVAAHYAGQLNP